MSSCRFDVKAFDSILTTKWLGRSVIYKDTTETTMDDAKFASRTGSPSGTAVLAEIQTKARGSKNHKWNAFYEDNLYVSFIIHRKVQQEGFVDRFDVEVSAALSVFTVLKELGLKDVKLKWPNDIWIRGHKLAGFLVEDNGLKQGSLEHIYILGIGLNVNADVRRNPDLLSIASSVRCELDGNIVNREKLLADICNNLEVILEWSRGLIYTEAMKNQLFNSGDTVRVHQSVGGKTSIWRIENIQDNWDIVLKDEFGKVWQGSSQQYSIRPYPGKTVFVYNGKLTSPWSAALLIKTFSALVDSCFVSVSSLNDAGLKDGSWKQNAALFVCGDIDCGKFADEEMEEFLSDIESFVKDGGKIFVTGNASYVIYSHIYKSSDGDTVSTIKDSAVGEKGLKEMSSVTVEIKNSTDSCIGAFVNKYYTFSTELLQNCNIFGWYRHYEDNISEAGAVVVQHGKGLIGLVGFNIEITYADIDDFETHLIVNKVNDLEALEKTVFTRDCLIKNIIEYLFK